MPLRREKLPLEGLGLPHSLPKREIEKGFETLIGESRLFGAELNPDIIKKEGAKRKFLVSRLPSRKKLLFRWERLFRDLVSPARFFERVSEKIQDFEHRENMLLVGKDRIIYDTQIAHGSNVVGEMTLFFLAERDRNLGLLAYLHGRRNRIVYIDHIRLSQQSSGYASALFRHYETLFHDLGFHQFRLSASLSVGKYYWAKEGFDCLDREEFQRMKERLRILVKERSLSVEEIDINRLTHVYDIALFRRDLKIPVYCNAEGYYSLDKDEEYREEKTFPLGKAYLLSANPWDGYKIIYTNTPRRTGLLYSPGYLNHRPRAGHPENHKRLGKLIDAIRKDDLQGSLVLLEPFLPDMRSLEKVHPAGYLNEFRNSVRTGKKTFATVDCSISEGSFDVALLAAGGVMAGVDAVMNGRVDNIFCAVRPPGHHAGRASAMGFCFLNNVALGACYARAVYGVNKIFILDWDVHHGNGTQEIFEEDPLTYFCSIHEHPTFCFPGTGRRMEKGKGEGYGFTLNLPVKPHTADREFLDLFEREVIPEIDRFRPDLIMVSAGFDAHKDDPIADLELTERSFVHMTHRICEMADTYCQGRIVSVLEGGYNGSSLTSSAIAHIKTLQGRSEPCTSAEE
ncbi:MAG: histone deacetylase [Candidatus Deferrimicrobiaceae bacterium]